jgi:hypothetical protein
VFLDQTSLSASADLTAQLEGPLANSRFFILLASVEAAASPWVGEEVGYWLEHKPRDRFLIALGDSAGSPAGGARRRLAAWSRRRLGGSHRTPPACHAGGLTGKRLDVILSALAASREGHLLSLVYIRFPRVETRGTSTSERDVGNGW